MKYNKVKKIKQFFDNSLVKFIAYFLGAALMAFAVCYIEFAENPPFLIDAFFRVIDRDALISLFAVGAFTLIFKALSFYVNRRLEESDKTETDHRKIINQYTSHRPKFDGPFSKSGTFLEICEPNIDTSRAFKNPEKNKFSSKYTIWQNDYDAFYNPESKSTLTLSSINLYANDGIHKFKGIKFDDRDVRYSLPQYIHINSHDLLLAHSTTAFKPNETTIRLRDAEFKNNTLVLKTERSTYYEMLMTNRCMDYEHHPHMTLRQIYEYKDRITRLETSKMGNQIGINGIIITKDNYLLIEKRDLSKSTWKDKFSQPISLAMKYLDIKDKKFFTKQGVIKGTYTVANDIFQKIINKTIFNNYGITPEEVEGGFSLINNFTGLARDLLEGGKPNLYFSVRLNITANELKKKMEDMAELITETPQKLKPLDDSKLKSDFYLIHKDLIKIDYGFNMTLKKNQQATISDMGPDWIYINRFRQPRSSAFKCRMQDIKRRLYWITHKDYTKECSEALLVSLAYMQICSQNYENMTVVENEK